MRLVRINKNFIVFSINLEEYIGFGRKGKSI